MSSKLVGGALSSIVPGKRTERTMKYPYTFTAKLAHFPYAYYWKNNWFFRYFCYGSVLCLPIFYKIQKMCKYKQLDTPNCLIIIMLKYKPICFLHCSIT